MRTSHPELHIPDRRWHYATHIRDHGMASASDLRVLAKAAADGLTLITADRGDFGRGLRSPAPSSHR